MSFLNRIGIYPWDIDTTEERIEDAFKEVGLDYPEDLAEKTMNRLCGKEFTEEMGNTIIEAMLETAEKILLNMVSPYVPKIETYVNGADSRFSVNEKSADIIRLATENHVEYGFAAWLYDVITDFEDWESVIMGSVRLLDALGNLREAGGKLVWSTKEEIEMTEDQINEKCRECMENPEDITKIFFYGQTGRIWEYWEGLK